jgi:hypothetical protein
MSNSKDGVEEELDEGESWKAFGNKAWPKAELGFYVASHLLSMEEGERFIDLKFDLSRIPEINAGNIRAFATTEKEWVELEVQEVRKGGSKYNFIIGLTMKADQDPVAAYSEEVHQDGLDTANPVLKIEFVKISGSNGKAEPLDYHILDQVTIQKFRLVVEAELTETLQLQNELGNVDPTKPFLPFGSRPKMGSKLEIFSEEMSNKPVSDIKIDMVWLNVPSNFSEHYSHYLDEIKKQKQYYLDNIINLDTYNLLYFYKDETAFQNEYDLIPPYQPIVNGSGFTTPAEDTLKQNFQVRVESPYHTGTDGVEMFSSLPQVEISRSDPLSTAKATIDLILLESFYHDLYSEIYVNTIIGQTDPVDLPNEPYTPLLDRLRIVYTARQEAAFSENDMTDRSTLMYHRHPFGIRRADSDSQSLVPRYDNHEFYIGLDNLKPGNNISLLFQVAEGSENPLHSSFEEGDIDWWLLSDNEWVKIESADFARNQTNNFLRSGIAELPVSRDATDQNMLLEKGKHWLRIRLKKEHDAVSRFLNVHAQAGEAIFFDQGNATGHLADGLPPETIGQLVNQRAQIKSVSQPYAGFGGASDESDDHFYRRVSERLRHKERAVSIWDYEHLILEAFPSLYKAKCLNHTSWDGSTLNEMSPGDVTLVLIPKITEGNTAFRLKPMVSRDFQDRVEGFVNSKNSMHGTVKTANPDYESVRFEFKVRFHTGLDFNFYKTQAEEDLKKLLAPWVFETDAAIEFGGSFSEYQIVNYLENLEYVDFVTDFSMFLRRKSGDLIRKSIVEPSTPMSILVPDDNHDISEAQKC